MTPSQAVEKTLEKLNTARTAYEPYKYLAANNNAGREARKTLDSAWSKYRKAIQWMELQSAVDTAQSQLTQAQKDYDALQDPSFAENTAGARAALASAEVRAPFAGVITKLGLKVGEFATAGQPVVTIADMSSWVVKTTDLTEIDVVKLKEGQPVTIKLDAIPDVALKGNVFSISQNYSTNQGDVVYEITVLLTDKNPAMRWGMTAEVKFEK
jgi:multidrug resistance efflux pump